MIAKCLQIFFIGLIAGVGVASAYQVRYAYYIFVAAVMIAALYSKRRLIIVCCVIGFGFGMWYVSQTFVPNQFANYLGKSIDAEGVIVAEPEIVERNQQLTIKLDNYEQNLRASIYQPTDAHLGDRVWARGTLELPEDFNEFDYIGYLQRYNIYANLKNPRVIVLEPVEHSWHEPFYKLRAYMLKRSQKLFQKNPGGLIMGMLIGYRKSISEETAENFRKTGLMHVVAVSGFNMTILAGACILLAGSIGRKPAGFATITAIVCFVMIAGATASVIRSAIMAMLVVAAQFAGRLYNSHHALIIAAGVMVLLNPRIVLWDVGFQLSVVATAGVLYAYQLRNIGESETTFFEIARPTLGAIIATAPLVAFHFQTFSIVALPANILLLPLVPWIMLFGALSFFVNGFGLIANSLANVMLRAVEKFAALPYSSVNIKLSFLVVAIIYLLLFSAVKTALKIRKSGELLKAKNRDKL